MKLLSQFIELYLPGANSMQVIVAIGVAIMLLKVLVTKFYSTIRWKIPRRKKELEKDMWAIE